MSNPLLSDAFEIPFDRITPEHIEPGIQACIDDARGRLDAIATQPGPPTWANTLAAFDTATRRLDRAWTVVNHLRSVVQTPALVEAVEAMTPAVTDLYTGIALDDALWRTINAYAASTEAKQLTGARARFLMKVVADFKRHGADLPADKKARLREIGVELAQLGNRFGDHVMTTAGQIHIDLTEPESVAGIPEGILAHARKLAADAGGTGWRFTLSPPVITAVLTHAEQAGLRKHVWQAWNSRGIHPERHNGPIIERMLALRREHATLLGFADVADLILDDRMAKTGAKAKAFLDDLEARTRAAFQAETRELTHFRASVDGRRALDAWDVSFFADKLRKQRHDLDEEALRPYFELEHVLQGMFELVHRLYGITVVATSLPTWHDDVRTYAVTDADGTHLGSFYADLFPRPNKRAGAWMNDLLTGEPRANGQRGPHLGLICANLTPPSDDHPALLTHREVETLFHEFGHLLHHLLSEVPIRSLSGTSVAWDFVELPSQIMENWCWEQDSLALIARHHKTGEPLPADLYERLVGARTFRAASAMMRQLGFGQLDLYLHRDLDPAAGADVLAVSRALLARYSPAPHPDDAMVTSFLHLFSSPVGYAAGYYSYKWAEVLDADAFSRFKQEGIFSRSTGQAFRDHVLSQGDAADPSELIERFLGRPPRLEPLLERAGLTAAP